MKPMQPCATALRVRGTTRGAAHARPTYNRPGTVLTAINKPRLPVWRGFLNWQMDMSMQVPANACFVTYVVTMTARMKTRNSRGKVCMSIFTHESRAARRKFRR